MLWIILLLLFCLSLIAYLLFAPLSIEINTETNWYCLRYHRLMRIYMERENDRLSAVVNVLFWKRRIPFGPGTAEVPSDSKIKKQKKGSRKSMPWKKLFAILRSFRVRTFELVIDSGSMELNGILFPVLYRIGRYTEQDIRISFTGETQAVIKLENNIARMVRAFIAA
jgi:hypothetical protein